MYLLTISIRLGTMCTYLLTVSNKIGYCHYYVYLLNISFRLGTMCTYLLTVSNKIGYYMFLLKPYRIRLGTTVWVYVYLLTVFQIRWSFKVLLTYICLYFCTAVTVCRYRYSIRVSQYVKNTIFRRFIMGQHVPFKVQNKLIWIFFRNTLLKQWYFENQYRFVGALLK